MDGIRRAVVEKEYVRLTLYNGVDIDIVVNDSYLHLSFSGIEGGVAASPFLHTGAVILPRVESANYMEIGFSPRKKG